MSLQQQSEYASMSSADEATLESTASQDSSELLELAGNSKSDSRGNGKTQRKIINRLVEKKMIHEVSIEEYKSHVKQVYAGPRGALLATASLLSLHTPLVERLFKSRKFDLTGCKNILDVGSGAGQISNHLLKFADPDAGITCFDLSPEMLRRARQRQKSTRPTYLAADLSHLPFADESFDCVTCGYVLEHLPDPRTGLAELSRVMKPGGRMLLLTTEDSFSGAWTSYIWYCRTYNRPDLLKTCEEIGLKLRKELWFTRMHQMIKAGGICVELVKV
jgi:ubiquinone/menaquinone biosynthesis C-methylase UbiE